jgi:hypothetical protein
MNINKQHLLNVHYKIKFQFNIKISFSFACTILQLKTSSLSQWQKQLVKLNNYQYLLKYPG